MLVVALGLISATMDDYLIPDVYVSVYYGTDAVPKWSGPISAVGRAGEEQKGILTAL